jgi:hypothetical protein
MVGSEEASMSNERISDVKAREILQRAAEIDRAASEAVSIDTLRAAAHEAGIAPSSFDAALAEHASGAVPSRATPSLSPQPAWLAVLAVVGGVVLALIGIAVVSRLVF